MLLLVEALLQHILIVLITRGVFVVSLILMMPMLLLPCVVGRMLLEVGSIRLLIRLKLLKEI